MRDQTSYTFAEPIIEKNMINIESRHMAASLFLKDARLGYAEAQYNLGLLMCNEGRACRKGLERSVYWFRKAAEQGHRYAIWEMGYAYRKGIGVEKDYDEARKWFSIGAQHNDGACLFELGLMCFQGEGVAKSEAEAVCLWEEASSYDSSNAKLYLGHCYLNGWGGLKKDLVAAAIEYILAIECAEAYDKVNEEAEACLWKLYKKHPKIKAGIKLRRKLMYPSFISHIERLQKQHDIQQIKLTW